mmetsp:Transcript_33158/g.55861  ORF Transcript_33158/g.55861 Transcript_33158/m.55861 type:complete len:186 (+) Transcript_33158:25-582(+)
MAASSFLLQCTKTLLRKYNLGVAFERKFATLPTCQVAQACGPTMLNRLFGGSLIHCSQQRFNLLAQHAAMRSMFSWNRQGEAIISPIMRHISQTSIKLNTPLPQLPSNVIFARTKMKTHSGTKKRFRLTGSGEIKHGRIGRRHLLSSKTRVRKLRLKRTSYVDAGMKRRHFVRLLGGMKLSKTNP